MNYVDADVFAWEPPSRSEVVAFFFWLTHIPEDRFEAFWLSIDHMLTPGGRVWLLDNAHPELAIEIPGSPLRCVKPEGADPLVSESGNLTTTEGPI